MSSSSRSRSRSSYGSDRDSGDEHDFFKRRFGSNYESAFKSLDSQIARSDRKWGPSASFVQGLSTAPANVDAQTLDAQARIGISVNAQHLSELYEGIKGKAGSHIRLQQPPGVFDAISGKWNSKEIYLPDLINPSGHPNEKGLFDKKTLGKIVRAAASLSFPNRRPPKEMVVKQLYQRSFAELAIAFQSNTVNVRTIAAYLKKFEPRVWRILSPFFHNYAYAEVLADEALTLASQAQQLEAGKIAIANNFSRVFKERARRLILPSDPLVQRAAISQNATGFRPIVKKQEAKQQSANNSKAGGRGKGKGRGRGKRRSSRRRKSNRNSNQANDAAKHEGATPN